LKKNRRRWSEEEEKWEGSVPAGPLAPQCVGTGRTSTASGLFSMGEEEEDDRILEERERR